MNVGITKAILLPDSNFISVDSNFQKCKPLNTAPIAEITIPIIPRYNCWIFVDSGIEIPSPIPIRNIVTAIITIL